MKTTIISAQNPKAYKYALDVLQHGGVVAFPTDTVYGLATLAFHPQYAQNLYAAKGRSHNKAIAILFSEPDGLDQITSTPNTTAQAIATHFWPGPITIILPRGPQVPDVVSPLPTVGVRIPDHPVCLELFSLTGPLAVTSANLSEQPSCNTAEEVLAQMDGRIHLIIDGGRSPGGAPSTIVDCTTMEPKILRAGPITLEQISAIL